MIKKVIISGGGTGGHIFQALAVLVPSGLFQARKQLLILDHEKLERRLEPV